MTGNNGNYILDVTATESQIMERQAGDLPEIEITDAMIAAGAKKLIFDSELNRLHVAEDIIRSALEAAGIKAR